MNNFVANFRDLGASVNELAGEKILREGVLYRGGSIRYVSDWQQIENPRTVINLTKDTDPVIGEEVSVPLPAPDSMDVYHVTSGGNQRWIAAAITVLSDRANSEPFYIHCAAGKDRTGVIAGALLAIVGVSAELIIAEYEKSSGILQPELFRKAVKVMTQAGFLGRQRPVGLAERFLSN